MKHSVMVRNLAKSYTTPTGRKHRVFDNVNFELWGEKINCIIGPSGCGKSTFLNILCGFDQTYQGEISVDGQKLVDVKMMGAVFQNDLLFPWMTVLQNVSFGLKMRGLAKDECKREAEAYLKKVGLDKFSNYMPHKLSGGMQQCVSLARTLVTKPKIVILDEAFRSLDAITRYNMQTLLLKLHKDQPFTLIIITHDINEAIRLADQIVIFNGRPVTEVKALAMENQMNKPDLEKTLRQMLLKSYKQMGEILIDEAVQQTR